METMTMLRGIFRDIFDDEGLTICRETSADDIEEWDSLAQINIIAAFEGEFGVKFDINDITKIENVGDILDIIERKLHK
jgi:acyl carrier protein